MKLVLFGPSAIQSSLHDDALEFTGPENETDKTARSLLRSCWLATPSCKDLKVLLKLSHSISNHLCERFEREIHSSFPQNRSLLLHLNPKSSLCWKDTHSLINDILIEASAWEKQKPLPSASPFWLYETNFYFNLVLHNPWTISFNKKSAVTSGMSLKQNLSRKVKLLRKNTIQMSGKPILVLAHYTCSSIFWEYKTRGPSGKHLSLPLPTKVHRLCLSLSAPRALLPP